MGLSAKNRSSGSWQSGSTASLVTRSARGSGTHRRVYRARFCLLCTGCRDKLVDTARALGEFPELGRVVPELGEANIRECFVYSYRLIYRVEAERILILAVIHGRRLLENTERFPL